MFQNVQLKLQKRFGGGGRFLELKILNAFYYIRSDFLGEGRGSSFEQNLAEIAPMILEKKKIQNIGQFGSI